MNARSVCAVLGVTLLPFGAGCATAEDPGFGATPVAAEAAIDDTSEPASDSASLDSTDDTGALVDASAESSSDVDPVDSALAADTDDATADDTTVDDSAPVDSTTVDSTTVDSTTVDTGPHDTGSFDTSIVDTGPFDTGPFDTGTPDTGPFDTGVADTGPFDTGPFDTAPPPGPSVTVTAPPAKANIGYDTTSTACQSQRFSVSFTAPTGLKSLKWAFVAPDATKASATMVGSACNGAVAYQYSFDPAPFAGATSGTVQEDVAIAGNYSGTTSGPWWWCTAPGTSSTSAVLSSPVPGAAGVQPLSSYCAATTAPAVSDQGARWELQVTIVDSLGRSSNASYRFWIHQ